MYRSLFAPELITTRGLSVARATSIDLRIELTNASLENGFTIPDVPMMDSPPSMPRRGLKVRLAISSPPTIPIPSPPAMMML